MSIKNKNKLIALKERFTEWSGFEFTAKTLDEAKAEIEDKKYKLECEICDYARKLEDLAKETFEEE